MHICIHQQNYISSGMYILGLHIRKDRMIWSSDRDAESKNCCSRL